MKLSIMFTVDGSDVKNIEVNPILPITIYINSDPSEVRIDLKRIVYSELIKRGESVKGIEIIYAAIV